MITLTPTPLFAKVVIKVLRELWLEQPSKPANKSTTVKNFRDIFLALIKVTLVIVQSQNRTPIQF